MGGLATVGVLMAAGLTAGVLIGGAVGFTAFAATAAFAAGFAAAAGVAGGFAASFRRGGETCPAAGFAAAADVFTAGAGGVLDRLDFAGFSETAATFTGGVRVALGGAPAALRCERAGAVGAAAAATGGGVGFRTDFDGFAGGAVFAFGAAALVGLAGGSAKISAVCFGAATAARMGDRLLFFMPHCSKHMFAMSRGIFFHLTARCSPLPERPAAGRCA